MHPYDYNPAPYYLTPSLPMDISGMRLPRQSESLQRDLIKAINGEYSAIHCYSRLAQSAPNPAAKNRILEIRRDEERHLRIFSRMYTELTGRHPAPHITEQCPTEYSRGLEAAFMDEQETVDFYLEAADRAHDPAVKEQFRRIKADEQNHAVWFLYLLYKQMDH